MKILIILFKQIGDAVLSSVICNTLKKVFPESEIDYVYMSILLLYLKIIHILIMLSQY